MPTTKKIIYFTSTRFPTEKAHGLATVKICSAFVNHGYEVDVIAPRLWIKDTDDTFSYYNVKNNFRIFKIPCIDFVSFGILAKPAFILQSFTFSFLATLFIIIKYRRELHNIIIFSHDYIPLYFVSFFPVRVFYDIHHFPGNNFMYQRVMKKSFGFAVQTKWKIKELAEKFGILSKRIIYWPNGTDVMEFHIEKPKIEVRKELGIPLDKKIVMYTGQLFGWKGVDSLLQSVSILSPDTLVYLVGGAKEDVDRCKKEIPEANDKRVFFVPFQPHAKIPLWLNSADVLVLPNTGRQKVSLYYTSPMKLFEYMASGVPIVASRIPSIEEIVTEAEVFFVEADNAKSFAEGIKKAVTESEEAQKRAERAYVKVLQFTWNRRAEEIVSFMERTSGNPPFSYKVRLLFLARYLFSGLLAFTTSLTLLFIFKNYFHLWYLTASTFAFMISIIVSFLAQKLITFRDKSTHRAHYQFALFIVITLFNIIANGGLMFSFVDILHIPYMLAQVFSAGIIAVWNLVVYRYVVFAHAKIF
ncbi:MAG: glycosyltransferase [Patescibacteria group bacterium]